jgi:N-acetylglutamate synthase
MSHIASCGAIFRYHMHAGARSVSRCMIHPVERGAIDLDLDNPDGDGACVSTETDLTRHIERLAAAAWPADENVALDGWRLRHTRGVTRRANSVLAEASGSALALERRLLEVERWYAQRGQPARYQLCPVSQPGDLDARLAARGYQATAPTLVQVGDIAAVLQTTPRPGQASLGLHAHPPAAWHAVYAEIEHAGPSELEVRAAILARITSPTCYATVTIDGQCAAIGLAVLDDGWAGLFCIGTRVEWRRRGLAHLLVWSLADWARRQGAARLYLQVMARNSAARALYDRLGFRDLYTYHYRER